MTEPTMRSWSVRAPGPIAGDPLAQVDKPIPRAGDNELVVRVLVCGVCRTDLHVSEGDLPVHRAGVTPGHEIVGEVTEVGPRVQGFQPGDRLGIAWLRHTCGTCRYCRRGAENLCPNSEYTGWDADGGYAEFAAVDARYAYRLPGGYDDAELAPLLCAGIIGFRALRRSGLRPGGRLGIYGFGGSAHLTAQVALAEYGARVHVLTRGADAQRLALDLGVDSVAGAYDEPPEKLDAAITFAPVGDLVPVAMRALDRGGVLAVAGIHLSDVPTLNYENDLFYERELRSVTANTRQDGRDFLELAGRHHLSVTTRPYPMSRADQALTDLAAGRVTGAAVLVPDG
jgi:propanol-preferring alcohol dehydrogenase